MLVSRTVSDNIIKNTHCKLVSVNRDYHGYNGELCDMKVYNGVKGSGWTVTRKRNIELYIAEENIISEAVLDGNYELPEITDYYYKVADEICENLFEIEINTVTGKAEIRYSEDYHKPTLVFDRLYVCVIGGIEDEEDFRSKLRRKMKRMLLNKKAVLV